MYSDETLLASLEATIAALDAMASNIMAHVPPFASNPYHVMDRNGSPVLAPIVIARAQAFAAYTALRVEQSKQKRHEELIRVRSERYREQGP